MLIRTACIAGLFAASASAQISLSSIDTFDADNEGWRVGAAGVDPAFSNSTSFDGQPGFLRHFSDGAGPNGKFIMLNEQSDWTGDYTGAGVTGISLWADGRTGTDTTMWLGFKGAGGWFFTPGQTLTIADDWARFEFDIDANALIYQSQSGGTGSVSDTLADVTQFEIFAGPGPVSYAANGDLLRAGNSQNVVWFDNIAAVPAPGAVAALSAAGLVGVRRRR